ncbi:pentatricopeptide repeat-containing protein At2g39620 [Curcuma longa]|uniref:pentatricopeptide repeat-containing protein At2g39620 n=1 Tax=Curcuma longa TaxID=136217 RepID=UPI003D9EADAB
MLRLSTATPMPVGERANSAFVGGLAWSLRCCRPLAAGAPAIPAARPTCSTKHLTHLLRSCKDVRFLLRLHSRLVVFGSLSDDSSRSLLLNCYSSFGRCDAALALFNSSPLPTVALWNSMIRCYNRTGEYKKAVQFYHLMQRRGIEPDKYTFTFASKACAGALDSKTGDMIRREVGRRGLLCDVFISTGLVDMYSKLGRVDAARELFESMAELDAVSWNAMIAGFSTNGHPLEALEVFERMQMAGEVPNSVTFLNLFPAVCDLSALILCRAIHGFILRRSLLPSISNGLIDTYCKCRSPGIARKIFDIMSNGKDDVTWGTMISGYVYNGCYTDALLLFDKLKSEGLKLNQVSVVSALSAATETGDLDKGVSIHNCATEKGEDLDISIKTMLVTMYAKCGDLEKAKSMFDGIKEKDVIAWSAMISACVQTGHPEDALVLYRKMQMTGVMPNQVTMVSLLPACADLLELKMGKSIHSYVLKYHIHLNVSVETALIAMYAQCGSFSSAHALFNKMEVKDIVTWNALINGYTQVGDAAKALELFNQLRLTGKYPDPGTMVGALPSCAILNAIELGACLHGLVIKNGFNSDLYVKNATIDMYAKCGDLSTAEFLFLETKSCNDVISWNTMFSGYMHNGCANEALSAFRLMRAENVKPNLISLISIIPAASFLAAIREGSVLHSYVIKTCFVSQMLIGNCLIDMYTKCGRLDCARDFFDQMDSRDVVSWNVMLAGYAIHGHGERAISLFSQMKGNCVKPDSVSFLSVLSACRHAGLIAEGKHLFESIMSEYQLEPNIEHYACMVDLLGRSGQLGEAWSLIQSMPMTPDAGVWGALLGASRMHSNVAMGEIALDNLVKIEPENVAHYVVLSNIYAQVGRWTDVRRMRVAINNVGVNKTPGCSWVYIRNTIHAFSVGDQSHPQYEGIRDVWNHLHKKLEMMGYIPDTSHVMQNVEEEEKESFLSSHSERLALCFAILNTEDGVTIQIVKNLRACGDCHTVIKLASKITNRVITVRDSSRFHHFDNGVCSCKDYW